MSSGRLSPTRKRERKLSEVCWGHFWGSTDNCLAWFILEEPRGENMEQMLCLLKQGAGVAEETLRIKKGRLDDAEHA